MKKFFRVSITVHHIGEKDSPKSYLSVGLYLVDDPDDFKKLVDDLVPKDRRIPPQKRVDFVRDHLAKKGFMPIPEFEEAVVNFW
jgi:hypothetical protein